MLHLSTAHRSLVVAAVGLLLCAPLLFTDCTPADQQALKDLSADAGVSAEVKFEMHFERYDEAKGSFEVLTPPPKERNGFSVVASGGKLLVLGGLNVNGNYTSVVEGYDPTTQTWSTLADWPKPRAAWFTAVGDGLVCAVGGFLGADVLHGTNQIECYDVATDTWSSRAPVPDTKDTFWPATLDGKLYVVGGTQNTSKDAFHPVDTASVYDPTSDTWTSLAKLPAARGAAAVHPLGGKLYMVGGFSSDWLGSHDDTPEERSMLVYSPQSDSWALSPQMPNTRWLFGTAPVGNDLVVFFGLGASNLLDRYDPSSDAWTSAPDPTQKLDPGVYTYVVHEGALYLLVLADRISTSELSASGKLWKFDMASNTWSVVAQRGADDRDALFVGETLGGNLYFTGAFTQVKLNTK